jgi:hypothetical protein
VPEFYRDRDISELADVVRVAKDILFGWPRDVVPPADRHALPPVPTGLAEVRHTEYHVADDCILTGQFVTRGWVAPPLMKENLPRRYEKPPAWKPGRHYPKED